MALHARIRFERSISVPIRRLDGWCEEMGVPRIDFIWMDVQGAELDVIAGGVTALRNTRYLYTECNERELYEGQVGLRGLSRALPDFRVLRRYPDDVLFANGKAPGDPVQL